MTVESLAMSTVQLFANQVKIFLIIQWLFINSQVLMLNKSGISMSFKELDAEDTDLTMFTMTNLTLKNDTKANIVYMALKLKRKVTTELLTTYFPTVLLLLITLVTIFFDKDLFGDHIAVNLTIMLVMTTIFTSKIEELPPTSDMKMIDLWLIFCLVVPFTAVILRTAIESLSCICHICSAEPKKKGGKEKKTKEKRREKIVNVSQEVSSGEVTTVWVGTGPKVAPQQVTK